jgi:hypothetical protein
MAGFIPAIHVFGQFKRKTWMPGTSPGMTKGYFVPDRFLDELVVEMWRE